MRLCRPPGTLRDALFWTEAAVRRAIELGAEDAREPRANPALRRKMFMMPSFKIHRLRDHQFQQFRWAPHTAGASQARPKDYTLAGTIEAASAYAAWTALKDSGDALRVGDILEAEDGRLSICKYVGFEEAQWIVPEAKPAPEAAANPAPDPPLPAAGEIPKS